MSHLTHYEVILAPDLETAEAVHALDPDCLIVGLPDGTNGTLIDANGKRAWIHFAWTTEWMDACELAGCLFYNYDFDNPEAWKVAAGWVDQGGE